MGGTVELADRGTKSMKKLSFALVGTAALALGACGSSNQDQVNDVELNQPSADLLNEQANQAAMDAANTAAEANQQAADMNAAATVDDAADDEEQNVSGM